MSEHTPHAASSIESDGLNAPPREDGQDLTAGDKTNATPQHDRGILFWSLILFNFAVVVFLLKWGELFFIPLFSGILLSYTLAPMVNYLVSLKLPRWLGANIAILTFVVLNGLIGYAVWQQAIRLAESLPETVQRIGWELKNSQNDESSALSKINKAADAITEVIEEPKKADSASPAPSNPQGSDQVLKGAGQAAQATVVVQSSKNTGSVFNSLLFNRMMTAFGNIGMIASVLLLAYFLLAAGDQFRRKTVSVIGDRLKHKRITVQVLDEIDRSVQKYLGSMFLTNLILGVLTYIILWLFGFENARVWGLLTGILHVIPYLGTLLTAAGIFITGLQQWGDISMAASASGVVFLTCSMVGTLAQTWIFGKIVNINHTAQFIALLFFGWLWGAVGMLIAMPLLVVIKVISARIDVLNPVSDFLKE